MAQDLKYTLSLKDLFSSQMRTAENATTRLDNKMNTLVSGSLRNLAVGLGGAFAVRELITTTAKMESLNNVINYTSIDAADAAKNHEFLNSIISRLKLPVIETTEGFSKLSGAMLGSNLQGEQTRKIFEGVATAATAFHLTADDTNGVFLALSQMMSKGTVSAEELRGQLGERMPGAFRIAAQAMGVTQKKLGEMMKQGEVVSEVFLPKFAEELQKQFGGAIPKATQSLQANINELGNKFISLTTTMGELLLPTILKIISGLVSFMGWIKKNIDLIAFLTKTTLLLVGAFYAYRSIMASIVIFQGAKFLVSLISLTAGLQGVTTATYLLSAAMNTIPLLALITMFGILINQIYNYQSISELAANSIQNETKSALETETKLVGDLAKSYEKFGFSKEEAFKKSLAISKQNLLMDIAEMKQQLDNKILLDDLSESELRVFNLRMANAAGRLNALNTMSMLGANSGNAKPIIADGSGTEISGTKPQNLYINIDKLVESLNITTQNIQESAARIKEEVAKALLEAVNDVNLISR